MLVVTDSLALLAAHTAAGALRFGNAVDPMALTLFAAMLPLYGIAAFVSNAYSVGVLLAPWESIRRALKALAIAITAAVFLLFLLQFGARVSRITFSAAAVFAVVGIALTRWFVGRNATLILGRKRL